ncbi:MAG: FAD-dependent oxidoreductase, partial [Candidatus Eremiobacteraeota bacterium]|nr:FAD-dependent oxidoreductase [Candidatus Eremiobacteraeota bacterium]
GGAAGMAAATRARRLEPQARITVVERFAEVSVGLCGLPHLIAGQIDHESQLLGATPEYLNEELGLELLTEHEAVGLDPRARTVVCRSVHRGVERELAYDSLIVAVGARPRCNLPGARLALSLNSLADGRRWLAKLAERPRRGVIVGGGYLGLSMAEALHRRGLSVALIEQKETFFGLPPSLHAVLAQEMERVGIRLRLNQVCDGIAPNAAELDGGHEPGDLFLLATGVAPNSELLAEAGARLGESGAVRVDQRAQTSLDQVWAAGDGVEVEHRLTGRSTYLPLATTAARLGRLAAQNALGRHQRFGGSLGNVAVKVFGLEVASVGLTLAQANELGYRAERVEVESPTRASYLGRQRAAFSLVVDANGRILGAQGVGHEEVASRINLLATAIEAELDWSALEQLDLLYTPPLAPLWDPIYLLGRQASRLSQESPDGRGKSVTYGLHR